MDRSGRIRLDPGEGSAGSGLVDKLDMVWEEVLIGKAIVLHLKVFSPWFL